MNGYRLRLPPVNALVVFEAVARHLSFTAAARELGVSQAATSRQVRLLEDFLGMRVFSREGKRVHLTKSGEKLHLTVAMALGHIATTTDTLRRSSQRDGLTVATSIAFSAFWLMPRISAFNSAHPNLDVRLVTSDLEADWLSEDVDVAVIYREDVGDGAGQLLFGDEVIAVCHPDYLAGRTPPCSAEELLTETLLHFDSQYPRWMGWPKWLELCGVKVTGQLKGLHFTHHGIAIQAAQEAQGIVLGWRRLVEPMLNDRRLMQVTDAVVCPDEAYWIVIPGTKARNRKVTAFRDWILAEARK
jgi:DNA-binding transcriptional LysR family regulator